MPVLSRGSASLFAQLLMARPEFCAGAGLASHLAGVSWRDVGLVPDPSCLVLSLGAEACGPHHPLASTNGTGMSEFPMNGFYAQVSDFHSTFQDD